MRHSLKMMAAIAIAIPFSNANVNAEDLFTVTDGNVVNVVDTDAPTVVTRTGSISGLAAAESIFGLDYRANGGGIYAVGSLALKLSSICLSALRVVFSKDAAHTSCDSRNTSRRVALDQARSLWPAKTRVTPSRQCRDATVIPH